MTVVFFQLTLGLYFLGTVMFLVCLDRRSEALTKIALGLAGLGFFTHTIALAFQLLSGDDLKWVTFHKAMSFFLLVSCVGVSGRGNSTAPVCPWVVYPSLGISLVSFYCDSSY